MTDLLRKLRAGPDDRGLRLDVFLVRHLDPLTRSQIQSLNRSGGVRIEGRREKSGYRIRGGEAIEVDLTPLERPQLEAVPIQFPVVFEDDDLAVIEKPAGLVVHPGAGTGSATVVHGLLFHFRNLSAAGGEGRPGIVHRLDKLTSGLLVIAKNDWSHVRLSRAFQDRTVEKTYIALVHGRPSKLSGEIALKIGRHPTARTRMSAQTRRGREALSTYRVLEELKGYSLLEVKIKTGRTHQIRVHLAAIGHPVVGDNVYAEGKCREFVRKHGEIGRYFLHAATLRFAHPRTGSVLEFHSPLPEDLTRVLRELREFQTQGK
jgi:23S rRNA pseudouridine1911/1915/1917 synthase